MADLQPNDRLEDTDIARLDRRVTELEKELSRIAQTQRSLTQTSPPTGDFLQQSDDHEMDEAPHFPASEASRDKTVQTTSESPDHSRPDMLPLRRTFPTAPPDQFITPGKATMPKTIRSRPYKCAVCTDEFKSTSSRNRHVRRKKDERHKGAAMQLKDLTCTQCGLEFERICDHTRHLKGKEHKNKTGVRGEVHPLASKRSLRPLESDLLGFEYCLDGELAGMLDADTLFI